jgi:hydroxymethylglutaryl-CoA lyase
MRSCKVCFSTNLTLCVRLYIEFDADTLVILTSNLLDQNINCSIAESMQRFEPVIAAAREVHLPVRGYVSCVLGCPYEGAVKPSQVAHVSEQLLKMGCMQISLGDTIGVGTASSTQILLDEMCILFETIANDTGDQKTLAVHFHDTYGQALANILVALDYGIRTIDSSVAGLGGCPYAKGASGNVATEDVVYMLNGLGMQTGIDLEKLVVAGDFICKVLGHESRSKAGQAILAKMRAREQ